MNERKPKILLLADSAAFHTQRFARELHRQGCRILCVSLEAGELPHIQLKRFGIRPFVYYPLAMFPLKRIIKRFKPDIINAHYATSYGFTAALAAGSKGVPIALNLWGSDILIAARKTIFHKWRTGFALSKAAVVFADSKYLLEKANKLSPVKNGHVIPWGIEKNYLERIKKKDKQSEPVRIIVPRAHEDIYNNEFIVESLVDLLKNNRITISFPSFGNKVERFRQKLKNLAVANVILYDKKPRSDFMGFLSGHDIYLSAAASDSSPVSLIEAMALGLRPVAAKIEGIAEWLNAKNGFLFKLNDPESLITAVVSALSSSDTFDPIRQTNINKVKNEALFEENVAEHIKLMKDLI